jgi:exodeoxyribonuclease VII small subunit
MSHENERKGGPVADGTSGDTPHELTIEGRLDRLNEIVGALDAEDMELDRALELFEEGIGHIRAAEKTLAEARLKVEELIGEEGDTELRSFEHDDQ